MRAKFPKLLGAGTPWLLACGFFAASALSAPPNYALFDNVSFPNPPMDTTSFTALYGVNDTGTIVGYYNTLNGGSKRLGLFGNTLPSLGGLTTLSLTNPMNPPCVPTDTFPAGISSTGAIAGGISNCGVTKGSFLTTNNGASFNDFNPPASLLPSGYALKGGQATALNATLVIGYFIGQQAFSFAIDGYTTSDGTNFTAVIDPNTGAQGVTIPAGINANGDIVGLYVNGPGASIGFLRKSGVYYDVLAPSGVNFTDATGIDSNGDIVGFYKDAGTVSHGFIWSGYTLGAGAISGGTFTTIDDPHAGNNGGNSEGTQVLGISPNGLEIVGLYKNSSGTLGYYGVGSSTTLMSSQNPSNLGQSVTFTAMVQPAGVTGSVTFLIDGTPHVVSLVSGQAQFSTSTLGVGPHSVSATYTPGNYGTSAAVMLTQTVNATSTATGVMSSANPSMFGQSVTFTATVSPTPDGGTVTFTVDGTPGSPIAVSGGHAAFTTSTLSVGGHTVSAGYSGDTNFGSSSGNLTPNQSVNKASTNTALISSLNPSTFSQTVTFTATVTPASGTPPTNPTGNVTFSADSTPLQTVSLNGSGQAAFSTSALTAGAHTISASYIGDGNFSASTGNLSPNQTVNKASTSTALSSSPNPSSSGQTVTFTATVTPTPDGGTVTFTIDSVGQSPVAVSGGQAQFPTSTLSVNSHTVTAVYNGDSNFQASAVSNTVTQVVNPAGALTLSPSINPSVFGQAVTFTATVPPGTTGTITFAVDGIQQGSPVNISSNQAAFTTSALAVGARDISATYTPGNAIIVPATVHITQTVNKASTTTGLGSSVNPSNVGQSVTFTATVAAVPPGAGTPTGMVTFSIDGVAQPPVSLNGSAQAALTTSTLAAGSHSIQAVYAGDGVDFTGSMGNATQTVNKLASTTALTSAPNPSSFGQPVTFTATVTSGATGAVQFSVDGTPQQTVNLSGNQAQFVTSTLPAGNHSVVATYDGNGTYQVSTSNTVMQTVGKAAGAVGLSSSVNPSALSRAVTFTATLPAGATGTVTFSIDGVPGAPVTVTNNQAQFATSSLTLGNHTIAAAYSGDSNFAAGSNSLLQTVNQLPIGTVTLSSTSNPATFGLVVTFTATVPAGATGTITFTIDGKPQASVAISGNQAQFTPSTLAVGNHTVTAAYSGDSNFLGSTSAVLNQVIGRGSGGVGMSASPSPSFVGQAVTFLATVPVGATGTITFSIDGVSQPPQSVVSAQASFTTASLSAGTHTIGATYSGDANFGGGSNSVVQQVQGLPPALLSLTSSQNPSSVGQPVTFTVALTRDIGVSVNGLPIAFFDGTVPLGIAVVQNSQAALTTSALLAGSHTILAQVPGTSIQLSIGQVVNGMASATTVTAGPLSAVSGQPVTITAQVGPGPSGQPKGIPPPSGQVTFQDNGFPAGTVNLSGGTAVLMLNNLPVGSHQFTAIYSGDKFWASSFARVTATITAPLLQISSAAAPLSSAFSPDEAVSIFHVSGLTGDNTSSLPLGTSLANVSVKVTDSANVDRLALLYGVYASAGQINLVIPADTAMGMAKVTVTGPGGTSLQTTAMITPTAPALFTANMNGAGILAGQVVHVHADGTQTIESAAIYDSSQKTFVARPIDFGPDTDQVFLVLYGTGIRHHAADVTATVNGGSVSVQAAPQGDYPGLDQVNLGLSRSLTGAGTVNIVVTVDGQAANTVTVTTQ